MNTFTVRYRLRNGQLVDRVLEARDKRDAFKIAQRHGVTPVLVQPGGVLPKDGEPVATAYAPGTVRIATRNPWWQRLLFWR